MPEIFIKTSLIEAKFRIPFKNEVKIPERMTTIPCPIEKQKSINPANIRFLLRAAKLIMPANIGVEQGLAANANNAPIINGYINKLVELPFGNFFTIGEIFSSINPNRFKPKTKIKEAKNITQ